MATKVIKQNNRGLTLRQQNILRMKEELNKPDEKALHPFTKYKNHLYIFQLFYFHLLRCIVFGKRILLLISQKKLGKL